MEPLFSPQFACGPGLEQVRPSKDLSCSAWNRPAVSRKAPLRPTHPHTVPGTMVNETEMRMHLAKSALLEASLLRKSSSQSKLQRDAVCNPI